MTDTTRILVIEGDSALRGELTSALTEAGHTVADVPDYPEALAKMVEKARERRKR